MRLSALTALFFALVSRALADDGSDVLDLTSANFDSTVNPADLMMVEFFAPWCGHCKSLAPRYEEAATTLKPRNIPVAKVDCVDQDELCKKFRVSGYPTLKVFKKGVPSDYNGPRTTEGIVTHLIKASLPPVSTIADADHSEFIKGDKVVVVHYGSGLPASFQEFAEAHREDYLFGHSADQATAESAGITPPAIVVYRNFDEPKLEYAGDVNAINEETFGTWLKGNAVPVLDEVTGDNYKTYAESGLPLAYIFIDPIFEGKQEVIDSFKPLAREHKDKLNFAWIDANRFMEHAKSMNLKEPKWPAFVIQDIEKQLKFPLSQDVATIPENVGPFVKEYLAGKMEPSLRSAPVPVQDSAVYTVVGSQFDEVVFDDSKDVLIEFYAPWCGHCKRLAPIYENLGEKFASVKDKVVIAKMDATENDIPPSAPFRVNGFPTIKFKPAGGREFIDYDGDRTLESFEEFITKHAKNKFVLPATTETSSTSESTQTPEAEKPAQQHVEL